MPAFCRYIEPSGRTRFAYYQPPNPGSMKARVCPLAACFDEQFEESLVSDSMAFLNWSEQQIADLAQPHQEHWHEAPERFLPPVSSPEKVICIGLNYLDHALETGAEPPTEPVVFSKFNSSIVGCGDEIILPRLSKEVDYEAELVVVIGRTTRHVGKSDAMESVFGFTAGHDVSARDWQKGRPGGQWLLGKSFDTFAPIGPAVVTKEQFGDAGDASVKMHLNEELVQSSTTAQLIFDIPALISHLSGIMTLRPGDLIFTGTPPGVGAAKTPPRFLQDGDVCTVEISGIGRLTNVCRPEITPR